MRDWAKSQTTTTTAEQQAAAAQNVGRSTLSEQLALDDSRPPAMFEAEPRWEAIAHAEPTVAAEPPLPAGETAAFAARSSASEPAGAPAPATPPGDAVVVGPNGVEQETVYGDDHKHAHGDPFERDIKHGDQHWAKQDQFNRRGIHSDKATVHEAGRPGVAVHGHGVFMLKVDTATRYTFSADKGINVATPFDLVHKKDLSPLSFASHLTSTQQHQVAGRHKRLLLNPSTPRELHIDGHDTLCVLSWVDGMGAAWIPLKDLSGDTSAIHREVDKRAHHEDPAAAHGKSTHYIIRNDAVAQETAGDGDKSHARVLAPGQHGGDNVAHYLDKDERKPGFDAAGKPTGKNVTRSFVALCMNLPEHGVPPVAIDTMLAGESFFVMNDAQFHREVAVYANGAHQSKRRQMWVFGHVGKRDHSGSIVPDATRRGWVPLRVLALDSKLVVSSRPANP